MYVVYFQVWVGTVSKGPRGGSLLGSYQNSETYAYQDEIGEVVLKVCQVNDKNVAFLYQILKVWRSISVTCA